MKKYIILIVSVLLLLFGSIFLGVLSYNCTPDYEPEWRVLSADYIYINLSNSVSFTDEAFTEKQYGSHEISFELINPLIDSLNVRKAIVENTWENHESYKVEIEALPAPTLQQIYLELAGASGSEKVTRMSFLNQITVNIGNTPDPDISSYLEGNSQIFIHSYKYDYQANKIPVTIKFERYAENEYYMPESCTFAFHAKIVAHVVYYECIDPKTDKITKPW